MTNAIRMTMTRGKHTFVDVVEAYGMKLKNIEKWRNSNGKEINWKRKI
jgi:hypothetical protein